MQAEGKEVLVTGGAGFIGTHICVELIEAGYRPVVIDNFVNSTAEAIKRVEEITGAKVALYGADLLDYEAVDNIFDKHKIYAVLHLAGLKAVGESVAMPLQYYNNNLCSTFNLLKAMKKHYVTRFVFSSSATVYGDPASVPITEHFPLHPTNPYGKTKYFIEEILTDYAHSFNSESEGFKVILLRYFNPIGAHKSGRIGENPRGIPNNLLPFICQVAVGKLPKLKVFGKDWPTHDGTGVRDYLHVVDLAKGNYN